MDKCGFCEMFDIGDKISLYKWKNDFVLITAIGNSIFTGIKKSRNDKLIPVDESMFVIDNDWIDYTEPKRPKMKWDWSLPLQWVKPNNPDSPILAMVKLSMGIYCLLNSSGLAFVCNKLYVIDRYSPVNIPDNWEEYGLGE